MSFNITDPVFHDATKAREFLEAQRWPDGPVCPFCGSLSDVKRIGGAAAEKGLCHCAACRKKFSVTVGTVMERSHIPLTKWLMTFRLMASSKKGVSAHQVHRMLGITYKSAWFLCHRVREAMGLSPEAPGSGPIGGEGKIIEADETFVGGKNKNVHRGKPEPKKQPVVALVERGGQVRAKHVADVTAKTIRGVLVTQASRKSDLKTDDSLTCYWLGREFRTHESVNHSKSEYVRGDSHTNTLESFFSIIKRQIYGTHHANSEAHLQRYVAGVAFKWYHRIALGVDDCVRTNAAIRGSPGKRLTYRRIGKTQNA